MAKLIDKPLTGQAQRFVDEMLADPEGNQTDAAIRAGYSSRSAHVTASQWMRDPRVVAQLSERRAAVAERVELTAADVLRDILNVATCDANELTEYRVGCCRYCHGDGHDYQRTPSEYRAALAEYMLTSRGSQDPAGLRFDHKGGVGYDVRRDPHPNCPECFGEGVGRTIIKDTRRLSERGRALYTGVKETRHGVEVTTRSKDKAIDLAARHTGVIKAGVEVTGKNGGPIQHATAAVQLTTTDPIEAAREYQKLMGGG